MAPKSLFSLCVLCFTLGVLATCGGCAPKDRWIQGVENAAALAQYRALLEPCKQKAIAAQDIVVFERCADDVDKLLCSVNVAFCSDGGI